MDETVTMPNEWLDGPSSVLGGSGMFSVPLHLTGGAAAPSSVSANQSVSMNNPFSFAASGGKASATASSDPSIGGLSIETLAFLGVLALLAAIVVRKKA